MKGLEQKFVELLRESGELAVERMPDYWVDRCQSPIEKLMLLALWSRGVWTDRLKFARVPDVETMIEDATNVRGMASIIAPQVMIGSYRVDFMIAVSRPLHHKDVALIAVECDGHEFHERTKEQAAKDKARDRELAARGLTVLRFTGSEIWRDAGACADDVLGIAEDKAADDAFMQERMREKADYIPERHQ